MRPFRLLLSVVFLFVTVFLTFYTLLQSHPPNNGLSKSTENNRFKALFAFRAPSSLFPPSAIISLTDDNTTFFLSRPATYGPGLPADGLSGQLWVGSGFGDDTLVRGGMVSNAQGELGCSDIPGWIERGPQTDSKYFDGFVATTKDDQNKHKSGAATSDNSGNPNSRVRHSGRAEFRTVPEEDDATDDYLHFPLKGLSLLRGKRTTLDGSLDSDNAPEHADIQALQEGAEIAGKVVLLSRGGCGFLEKTKWAQRRGAIALIVGDYTRGGQLIGMFAHGDTSNVSIPSIFTAHTSAHLLSSLVPPDSITDGSPSSGDSKAPNGQDDGKKSGKKSSNDKSPAEAPVKVANPSRQGVSSSSKENAKVADPVQEVSWLNMLATSLGIRRRNGKPLNAESRRPPSSGELKWIQSDDWDDDPNSGKYSNKKTPNDETSKDVSKQSISSEPPKDDFVIGVHDWRDPDLVGQVDNADATTTQAMISTTLTTSTTKPTNSNNLPGGSRLPESGVYGSVGNGKHLVESSFPRKHKSTKGTAKGRPGWFASLFRGPRVGEDPVKENKKAKDVYKKKIAPHFVQDQEFKDEALGKLVEHEGLWVTITPTSVSTSPFFDTLLVLVVSPLVTLTVVYALLLLRSRIRRRRWRAPRSVVDRLPVRTYHTMSYSTSSTSSATSSPHDSSPASPLLQSGSVSGLSRTRPRSGTTSTIRQGMAREDAVASLERATAKLSGSSNEKGNAFKRKYSRKQVECVVCLEEYVDGQSRVMSLPCGHEFHAECM